MMLELPEAKDFLSAQAIIPCALTAFASVLALHSLVQPAMTIARRLTCLGYALTTIILTLCLWYFGATQHQDSSQSEARAQGIERNLGIIRTLLGSDPHMNGTEVLQSVVSRISSPWDVTDVQAAKLVDEVAFVKPLLPMPISVARASQDNSGLGVFFKLLPVFARNGIAVEMPFYLPASSAEVGLMFVVSDPDHPPEAVEKLINAFQLVGLAPKLVKAGDRLLGKGGFTLFVGPKPLG